MDTTRQVTRTADGQGGYTEEATEPLCSVEIGATAKGEPQIKSVKVYRSTASAAAREALDVFEAIQRELGQ